MKSYIPDYPRPQLVRKEWTNLNGVWDFAFDDDAVGEQQQWNQGFLSQHQINVPFTYETKASGIEDPSVHEHVWYQKKVDIEKKSEKKYLLHLEGSDYLTKVWVNGAFAGEHRGAYERATYDITNLAKDGENLIVIGVEDSLSILQPRGKQRWRHENFGCWYIQTTGIWKSVWLEEVPDVYIGSIKMTPNITDGNLELEVNLGGRPSLSDETENWTISGEVSFKDRSIREFSYSVRTLYSKTVIDIKDYAEFEWGYHPWSPEEPNLYDIVLYLKKDDTTVDEVGSYFGMREVRIDNGFVLLNGRPIFQRLILDQGYWEDSHLTPPSEAALIEDIDKIHQLGFNGLRKHMKIEDERFLYWCDVKGMLVWSEMAACYEFNDEAVSNFTDEWVEIVKQNYNHPSIITWTPFNESWGVREIEVEKRQQKFTESIYYLTKSLDQMRPVITNDGWEHTISDILTLHDYEEKGEVLSERYILHQEGILDGTYSHNVDKKAFAKDYTYKGQPVIISEYGGIAFKTSKESEWGYGNQVSDEKAFLARYRSITNAIANLPYVSGFCYTQVSDVQQEVNGLMTIDRKFKVDPAAIKEINEGCARKF